MKVIGSDGLDKKFRLSQVCTSEVLVELVTHQWSRFNGGLMGIEWGVNGI
jgi:hypothetical protein